MTPRFSKREAIRFGWDTMKRHVGFFVLLYLVYGLIIYVPGSLLRLVPHATAPFQGTLMLVFQFGIKICLAVLGISTTLGFVLVALKCCDNERVSVGDLFAASGTQVLFYFVASVLAGILVGVGYLPFLLLALDLLVRFSVIPLFHQYTVWLDILTVLTLPLALLGTIWSIRLSKFPYFIIDKGRNPIDALKDSWAMTRGSTWNLMLFNLLLLLVNLLGALAFGVGLLATIPTTQLAHAFVYRKLSAAALPAVAIPA